MSTRPIRGQFFMLLPFGPGEQMFVVDEQC